MDAAIESVCSHRVWRVSWRASSRRVSKAWARCCRRFQPTCDQAINPMLMAAMAATERASGPKRPRAGVGGRPGPEDDSVGWITALKAGEAGATKDPTA